MPATILPFVRRTATDSPPVSEVVDPPDPPGHPELRPQALPTSRQIAHRWAMLAHLKSHGGATPRDPLR